MLKMVVGFVLFAALAIFVIIQGGNSLNVSGEKHDADTVPAPAEAASAK